MTTNDEAPLTRNEILTRVQWLCRSFAQNMAYYRAGRSKEFGRLFEATQAGGNFWISMANNCLDMCVLDWCKLFGEKHGHYSWRRIVAEPDAFKASLLAHLGLDEAAFEKKMKREERTRQRPPGAA